MDAIPPVPPPELDQVRLQLRELGYLSHRVDRILLQDALRPVGAWGSTWRVAVRIGVLAGVPLAAAGALALALGNGLFVHDPLAVVPLVAHLFVPCALVATLVFLALAGLELLVLARVSSPQVERLSGALTAAGALAAAVLVLLVARRGGVVLAAPALTGLALAAAFAGYAALSLLRGGLLALAVARTGRAPVGRRARSWVVGLGALVAAAVAVGPAVLAARPHSGPKVDQLPSRPGAAIVVIGVDGVLGEELDYLLARGDLPHLAALDGGHFSYRRPAGPPAAFWTTVASGVGPERHDVRAVDGFEPFGVGAPLVVPGALRWWWEATMEPLGLVVHRPALASRRNAAFVWELLARGGEPVVVVGWWSTFPAPAGHGALIAHGAWQLLESGSEVGVASNPVALEVAREVTPIATVAARSWLAGLPDPVEAQRLAALALVPDLAALAATRRLAAIHAPKATAIYLAGADVLAHEGLGVSSPLAFADVVRGLLVEVDLLAGELAGSSGASQATVVVVVDPGRRGDGSGRVLIRPTTGRCAGARGEVPVGSIAAALAREAGLPASAEGVEPPDPCTWMAAPALVPSWGRATGQPGTSADGAEYLESLRALGYLG